MKKLKYILSFAFIITMSFLLSGCIFGKGDGTYKIDIQSSSSGTITANKNTAKEGETITLSYTENDVYIFKYFVVDGSSITGNLFNMPNEDVVISAVFDTVTFDINYHTDTFTTHNNTKLTYNIKSDTILVSNASKIGYKFDGWYTEQTLQNKITEIESGTTGEINLYPKFNPIFSLNEAKTTITGLTSYALNDSTIEIPEKIEGVTLTKIDDEAFKNSHCTTLKFGKNITNFEQDVFKDCYGIENVYYFGELTDWVKYNFFVNSEEKISSHPFFKAFHPNLYLNGAKVEGSLTFPKEITKVGANCFYKLDDITTVNYTGTINEWLKIEFVTANSSPLYPISGRTTGPSLVIGGYGLSGEITVPSSVTSIQPGSLAYTKIEKVILPSSVKYICESAFAYCPWLEEINLSSSSVAAIYDKAFYNCKNLKIQNLPSALVVLGDYAFYGCCQYTSDSCSITIPSTLPSIGEYAFYGCTYLNGVTLNTRITEIKESTFENTGLTQITLPINITSIGHAAFRGCSNLTTVYVKKFDSRVITGSDDMFRDTAIQKIYFEDTEHKNLYANKVYWNLYAGKFDIITNQ